MKHLSVIILSHNTKKITKNCLNTLIKSLNNTPSLKSEIIIVDNGSTDSSVTMLKKFKTKGIKLKKIFNSENVGFAKGNNEGLALAEGKYILFLNSDVLINDVNFEDLIYYLNKNPEVGVLTVRVILPDGKIDMASHRGFPTLWSSLAYFTKLEALFKRVPKLSKIFGGYHLTHFDLNTVHEIDSPSGAFYLTRKLILDKIGGFDTKFFIYGEDLDLSYRIKKLGYKIIYYPLFTVTHLKYQSGLKSQTKRKKIKKHFYQAMKIFYDKHFAVKNGRITNKLVHFFIDLKEKISR